MVALRGMISDGVWSLGRFKPTRCGSFLLAHGGEAAVLEMPPGSPRKRTAWNAARQLARTLGVKVRYLLVTHGHWDHANGYWGFRREFPRVPLVVHRSMVEGGPVHGPVRVFADGAAELRLGGEPLHLVHAPKHSWQDTLVVFRGTVCTGDWTLGPMPDCNGLVPVERKVEALRFVHGYLAERGYAVHTAYSAHGNDLRRGVDFGGLLAGMIGYWQRFA